MVKTSCPKCDAVVEFEIDFYVLVHKMRKAQQEYYSTRSKDVLKEAIALEKQVDEVLKKSIKVFGE